MTRFFRLGKIVFVILYYGLDQLALSGFKSRRIRALVWLLCSGKRMGNPLEYVIARRFAGRKIAICKYSGTQR